ncbi:CRTISO2 [Scenedesmus sp. PABB004]|nr:CRTISO2 [Scenedesmus sp. PABB004]
MRANALQPRSAQGACARPWSPARVASAVAPAPRLAAARRRRAAAAPRAVPATAAPPDRAEEPPLPAGALDRDRSHETDYVVVGSGIGGLCCGALLARYGHKVTVVESHYLAGGAAHSFKVGGFTFDAGPSFHMGLSDPPGASRNPLKQVLDLLGERVECKRYDQWVVYDPQGRTFPVVADGAEYADMIRRVGGPDALAQWRRLEAAMAPLQRGAALFPAAAIRGDLGVLLTAARFFGPQLALTGLVAGTLTGPFSAVVDRHVTDPWLRSLIDLECFVLSGMLAKDTLTAEMAFMFMERSQGKGRIDYPMGGSEAIVAALVRGLQAHGGRLLLRSHVEQIVMQGGRAAGVALRPRAPGGGAAGGREVIRARRGVISNASVWDTQRLLPHGAAPPEWRRRAEATPTCGSFMHLHLGIDATGLPPGLDCHHLFVNDWADIEAPQNVCIASIPTQFDPDLAPPGKAVVHAYTAGNEPYAPWEGLDRRSPEYEALKNERSQVLWRALERVIPDVRERAELTLVGTPLTHERFLRRHRGTYGPAISAAGGAGWPSNATPVPGLTVVGDSTMPGIGIPAAAASGMIAANGLAPVWDHLRTLGELALLAGARAPHQPAAVRRSSSGSDRTPPRGAPTAMASAEELQRKLKDAVKQYEGKLAALSALNSALQKENEELRADLEEASAPKTDEELDALELKEEFARRLGEQQRTIDILKDTNARLQAKVRDAAAGSTATEAQVSALQEKLAKQQQDGAALAAKVAELEKGARRLGHRVKEVENERDRAASRAEVLAIQLEEARGELAAAAASAARALAAAQAEHADAAEAARAAAAGERAALEAALADARAAAAVGSEAAAAAAAAREAALEAALGDARGAAAALQEAQGAAEARHARALGALQEQVRALEREKQELLADSGQASGSLMRQIQSLAAEAAAGAARAADAEAALLSRLRAAEVAAAEAAAAERDAAGRAASAEAAVEAAKEAAAAAVQESAGLRLRLDSAQRHSRALEAERNGAQDRLAAAQAREQALQQELQQQQRQQQEALWEAAQKAQLLAREREELQRQLASATAAAAAAAERASAAAAGAAAAADERGAPVGGGVAERRQGSGAYTLQGLAGLGLDDGNGNGGARGRDAAARCRGEQLFEAVTRADAAAADAAAARAEHRALEDKLGVALEIIGERALRIEELQADVAEMKEIFRAQLQEAAAQLEAAQRATDAGAAAGGGGGGAEGHRHGD